MLRTPVLSGWWRLDNEGTGAVLDYSGYGRDGTLIGSPQFVPGVYGQALEFHGDPDYVNIDGYNRTCEATFSNIQITGTVGPQWLHQDIGIPGNDPEPMYVALTNSNGTTGVVYHDDPNAARVDTWTEWNIELQVFAEQGVNLANIDKLAIGFGDRNPDVSGQPGGSGKMYFDDIRLYRPRCVASLRKPDADFNNDCVVDHLDLEMMVAGWLKSDAIVATAALQDFCRLHCYSAGLEPPWNNILWPLRCELVLDMPIPGSDTHWHWSA